MVHKYSERGRNMKTKEFKKLADKRAAMYYNHVELSDKSYGGLEWSEWYKLAEMTGKIDYRCHFDKAGTCAQIRERAKGDHGSNKMCCCSGCANSMGYLKFIQNDQKVISKIATLFQPRIGFWKESKGCILPRKYRSAVCLGFRCGAAERSRIEGKGNLLIMFMDNIRTRLIECKDIYILGKALLKVGV